MEKNCGPFSFNSKTYVFTLKAGRVLDKGEHTCVRAWCKNQLKIMFCAPNWNDFKPEVVQLFIFQNNAPFKCKGIRSWNYTFCRFFSKLSQGGESTKLLLTGGPDWGWEKLFLRMQNCFYYYIQEVRNWNWFCSWACTPTLVSHVIWKR